MRHLGTIVLLCGLMLVVTLLPGGAPRAQAQDEGKGIPAGEVTFEPVAEGIAPPLVADQAGVDLQLAHFPSHSSHTFAATDEDLLLVAVESGMLTVVSDAPLVINRASTTATAGAQAHELMDADTEIRLGPGDSFVRPPESEQMLSNTTDEPATAFTASVATGGGIDARPMMQEAQRGGKGIVVAVAVIVVPECPEGFDPVEIHPAATPGGGGGAGGAGGVAFAIAAAPECAGGGSVTAMGTPTP